MKVFEKASLSAVFIPISGFDNVVSGIRGYQFRLSLVTDYKAQWLKFHKSQKKSTGLNGYKLN